MHSSHLLPRGRTAIRETDPAMSGETGNIAPRAAVARDDRTLLDADGDNAPTTTGGS